MVSIDLAAPIKVGAREQTGCTCPVSATVALTDSLFIPSMFMPKPKHELRKVLQVQWGEHYSKVRHHLA